LYVSIHTTDPDLRARILHNKKGATSLVWLQRLLAAGIEVHGQVVCCPGVNNADQLDVTLAGVFADYASLASVGVVPLGVSRFNQEAAMRPHSCDEFASDLDRIERWQGVFLERLGRRMVWASDEFYLGAGRPFPDLASYEDLPQLENGIGLARALEADALDLGRGMFQALDAAPAEGYRAPRVGTVDRCHDNGQRAQRGGRRVILTGELGARVVAPLVTGHDVDVVAVRNEFFGGNIGVTGLLTGSDVERALRAGPASATYFLPDVCLSEGRFLDERTPADVAMATLRRLEVVATTADGLRRACGEV
jgi:NifB/MoaA-like Fe-S oxidoreductase